MTAFTDLLIFLQYTYKAT